MKMLQAYDVMVSCLSALRASVCPQWQYQDVNDPEQGPFIVDEPILLYLGIL